MHIISYVSNIIMYMAIHFFKNMEKIRNWCLNKNVTFLMTQQFTDKFAGNLEGCG